MQQSETVGKLAEAIAKAQAKMGPAIKDASNPHFKSKYATLASVVDATKVLAEFGVAVTQSCENAEGGVNCETQLTHSSGEWIRGAVFIPVDNKKAQSVVSACTYGRRTGLAAAAGIAADDDDDGNAAHGRDDKKEPERKEQEKPRESLTTRARTALGERFMADNEKRAAFVNANIGRLPTKEEPMTEGEAATLLAALGVAA